MQGRIILNRNSNLQFWTGGVPDDWTQTGAATVLQLYRHMRRDHPARQVFPKHLKAHDLVQNGDFALRYTATAPNDEGSMITPSVAVAPGMEISVSIELRYSAVPGGTVELRLILYDDFAQTTALAAVTQPVSPSLENLPPVAVQMIGNPASYKFGAAVGTDVIMDDTIGASLRPGYWRRQGVSFEVPSGVGAMTTEIKWEGAAAGDACDVDDFRIEALNSRVHAGG